jgi:hypothetical protein
MSLPLSRHILRSGPRTPAAALRAALHTAPPSCRSAPGPSAASTSAAAHHFVSSEPPPRRERTLGRAPLPEKDAMTQQRSRRDARAAKGAAAALERRILSNSTRQGRPVPGDAVELRM